MAEICFFPAEELGHKAKVIHLTLQTPDDKTHYYTCRATHTLPQCYGIGSKDNSLIVTSENQKDECYDTSCWVHNDVSCCPPHFSQSQSCPLGMAEVRFWIQCDGYLIHSHVSQLNPFCQTANFLLGEKGRPLHISAVAWRKPLRLPSRIHQGG